MKGEIVDELELRQMGHKLADVRRARGAALVPIALASGLDIAAISRIERGQRIPNVRTLLALAPALKVDIVIRHDGRISVKRIEHVHEQEVGS